MTAAPRQSKVPHSSLADIGSKGCGTGGLHNDRTQASVERRYQVHLPGLCGKPAAAPVHSDLSCRCALLRNVDAISHNAGTGAASTAWAAVLRDCSTGSVVLCVDRTMQFSLCSDAANGARRTGGSGQPAERNGTFKRQQFKMAHGSSGSRARCRSRTGWAEGVPVTRAWHLWNCSKRLRVCWCSAADQPQLLVSDHDES